MRQFHISCKGHPDDTVLGSFSMGAIDAARRYANKHLSSYIVSRCRFEKAQETEEHGFHDLWRSEAYDFEAQVGVVIWIREEK